MSLQTVHRCVCLIFFTYQCRFLHLYVLDLSLSVQFINHWTSLFWWYARKRLLKSAIIKWTQVNGIIMQNWQRSQAEVQEHTFSIPNVLCCKRFSTFAHDIRKARSFLPFESSGGHWAFRGTQCSTNVLKCFPTSVPPYDVSLWALQADFAYWFVYSFLYFWGLISYLTPDG